MRPVLLINTSFQKDVQKVYSSNPTNPPLGLLAIAASLVSAKYDVVLIDPQIDKNYMQLIQNELKKGVLFVGMTTFMGNNLENTIEFSRYIKTISPDVPVVWGGPMATSAPEVCFEGKEVLVDHIVMGMGERTILGLADALSKGLVQIDLPNVSSRSGKRVAIRPNYFFDGHIDELPYPLLSLWERGVCQGKSIPILTSRGCPRNCAFCYNNTFIGRRKWFPRSPQNVFDEMEYWSAKFELNNFAIIDDNFLVDPARANIILKHIAERGYHISEISGHLDDFKPSIFDNLFSCVKLVHFSIETASPRMQTLLNKRIDIEKAVSFMRYLTEKGITAKTNFMFGLPTETDEDLMANIRLAIEIRNISGHIRMLPSIYIPQLKDDIVPKFGFDKTINFSLDAFAKLDMATNRAHYLSKEIRPWMSEDDIGFYLDFMLLWFFHFDYVVRGAQKIDVEAIYRRNKRLAKLFSQVPVMSSL